MEWASFSETDFGSGINQEASEDRIPPTFVEDLVNMDITSEGYLRKRDGFQSYVSMPIMGTLVWDDVTGACTITFANTVDLDDVDITPIRLSFPNPGLSTQNITTWTKTGNVLTFTESYFTGVTYDSSVTYAVAVHGLPGFADGVQKIKEYTATGETYLTAIAGGTLFKIETTSLSSYSLTKSFTSSSTAHFIGPAFYDDDEAPQRTRGYIQGDGVSLAGYARVLSVAYQADTGYTRYTLSFPSKSITGTPLLADYDELTVTGAGYSKNEGTFQIKAFDLSASASTITIDVENTARTTSDFDEMESGARAGVLTDFIRTDETSSSDIPDIAGDVLKLKQYLLYTSKNQYLDWGAGKLALLVTGVTGEEEVDSSTSLDLSGTASTLMLDSAAGLVIGDHIENLRVTSIDGNAITFNQAYSYSGDASLEESTRAVPLSLASSGSFSESTSLDNTARIDSVLAADSLYSVDGAEEIKQYDGSTLFSAGIQRFQPLVRIYVDYDNPTLVSIPDRYIYVASATTGFTTFSVVIKSGAGVLIPDPAIQVGDHVRISYYNPSFLVTTGNRTTLTDSAQVTKVTATFDSALGSNSLDIEVDDGDIAPIPWLTGSGPLYLIEKVDTPSVYKYYTRFEILDTNQQRHLSAPSHVDDIAIDVRRRCTPVLSLTIPPEFQQLNYDALTLKIFRTRRNGVVYHEIASLDINTDTPYVTFRDSVSDDTLPPDESGSTDILLKPNGEIGKDWEGPPFATSHMAVANNSLVVGNYSTWNECDIKYVSNSTYPGGADLLYYPMLAVGSYVFIGVGFTSTISDDVRYTSYIDHAHEITGVTTTSSAITVSVASTADFTVGDKVQLIIAPQAGLNIHRLQKSGALQSFYDADARAKVAGWATVTSIPSGTSLLLDNPYKAELEFTYENYTQITHVIHVPASDLPAEFSTYTPFPVFMGPDFSQQHISANPYFDTEDSSNVYSVPTLLSRVSHRTAVTARRFSAAINYTRQEIWAEAGSITDYGAIRLRSATSFSSKIGVWNPSGAAPTPPDLVFVNNVLRLSDVASGTPSAITAFSYRTVFPSRLAVSYPRFPTVFDAPYTDDIISSDSVIDVDPAEGGEITGITSLFGDSVFAAGRKDGLLIVGKANAMYAVDVVNRAVKKLESFGSGVSYPGALVATSRGVVYLHETGIWRVNLDLTITKLSDQLGRLFDPDAIGDSPVATQDTLNQIVKFTLGDSENNTICIYSEREKDGKVPGFSRHQLEETPTAFGRLNSQEFYGAASGIIHRQVRGQWNDNGTAITSTLLNRSMDFGDAVRRKIMPKFWVRFRNSETGDTTTDGTSCFVATELKANYRGSDEFQIATLEEQDNLSDLYRSRVEQLGFSCPVTRATYFQIKVTNTKDEPLDLTAIDYRVGGLRPGRGKREAADTQ